MNRDNPAQAADGHDRPWNPTLVETGLAAILRLPDPRRLDAIVDTLVGAGVRCLELTLTMDAVLQDLLPKTIQRVPDTVEVGVGTVLTAAQARQSIEAGSRFIVTPIVDTDAIEVATAVGIPVYAGGLTPTEIHTAWRAGATAVKLFPSAAVGPSYVRHLRGPLPDIPIIPTGGVTLGNAAEFIQAGCVALGVGSPLIADARDGGSLAELANRARTLLADIAGARGQHA